MIVRMQQRRGPAAEWLSVNPVLASGEVGFEEDTGQFKIGNGSLAWGDLPYASGVSPEQVEQLVNDALVAHTPGTEIARAEVFESRTSTAINLGAATDLAGLSITVTGTGRPVEVEYYCTSVVHSVANTNVSLLIACNGVALSPQSQVAAVSSPTTVAGTGQFISVRRPVDLALGVEYVFTVRCFAYNVAGTSTLYAASPYQPQFLRAVAA